MKNNRVSDNPVSSIPVSYIKHQIKVLKSQEEYSLYETDNNEENKIRIKISTLNNLIERWQKDSK